MVVVGVTRCRGELDLRYSRAKHAVFWAVFSRVCENTWGAGSLRDETPDFLKGSRATTKDRVVQDLHSKKVKMEDRSHRPRPLYNGIPSRRRGSFDLSKTLK